MNDVVAGSRRELSMSSKPVLLALLALGPVLYISGDVLTMPRDRLKDIIPYSFVLYGLVAASWRAEHCHELAGRWCTIVTLIIAAWLGCAWLRAPGFVALLPLPVVLATALVSPLASVAVALTETALAVLSHSLLLPDSDAATFCALLAALWGSCGVAYGVVRPVSRLSEWVTEYYYRAQGALQDARQHKVELEQTLQAFAHANRQLALANERTAALRAIAEESQRAKAAFVGNVSHELRTPLNMIIGLVELMVRHPEIYTVVLSPKMRKDLETVHRNCEHLLDMINDVLDLSRVEAGRFPLHREPVSLQDVVRRSVAAVSPLLEQKQLGLLVTIPEELPPAYCDRTRIEQVILNLLSNAARYTQAGHIEVEVSYGSEQVLVRVTDMGPGIRPEDAQRVFDPFYQAASTRSEGGGSGLGLSISKQFVELHGGRMWLESKLGAGTSFYFSLPLSSNLKHVVHPWHKIREDWVWREQGFTSGAVASDEQLRRPRIEVGDDDGAL
ncbi:MAG: HAMP domain-containing sensor histidine kinase, partial [Anaerolineae bacterium]|nr:HAMP domain-containing sensor histidine kinase [Anaerolineae bacterium]